MNDEVTHSHTEAPYLETYTMDGRLQWARFLTGEPQTPFVYNNMCDVMNMQLNDNYQMISNIYICYNTQRPSDCANKLEIILL